MRVALSQALAVGVLALEAPLCAAWVSTPTGTTASLAKAASLRASRQFEQIGASANPDNTHNAAAPTGSAFAEWARRALAAAAALAVLVGAAAGAPRAARAQEGGSVQLYFGQGCFWHVQHDLVKEEVRSLGRPVKDVTALAGYAGGNTVGNNKQVCYHNMLFAPDYGQMGHTEVVNVSVPESKVGDFAKFYIDSAAKYPLGRADPQDRGSEYRSAIGLPGGMDGPLFKQVEAANAGRYKLQRGQGNDADTVGTKTVWVYDSDKFPFYQGEVYHQFHDDMVERYSDAYHNLKGTLLDAGRLKKVDCPEMGR